MWRTWPVWLLLWMYSSASTTSSGARPIVLAGDPLVGCYQMTRVKPASAEGEGRIPMPPPFRLDSVFGTGRFSCGEPSVQWVSLPQDYFAEPASWRRDGPKSITVVWTNGFGALVARLTIHGDTLRGTATATSDVITGKPFPHTDVIVSRIPCPPAHPDSAAVAALAPPGAKRSSLTTALNWDSVPVGDSTHIFIRDSTDRVAKRSQVQIRWWVSDSTVATIDSSGLLRARSIGSATVVARSPERIALHDVKVVSLHLTQISTGVGGSCGLTNDGAVVCWGEWAPAGTGSTQRLTLVQDRPRLTTITVGQSFFCGLDTTGSVYCRGENSGAQLGLGYASWFVPGGTVHAKGVPPFRLVTAGADYVCGIATDSTAYCWGSNARGQLGSTSMLSEHCVSRLIQVPCSSTPIQVSSQLHFLDLAAGYDHTCGVLTNGAIVCWGDNTHGQLGDGSHRSSPTPVRVAGAVRFSSVAVGGSHSCGVATDGRGYCWGSNWLGELGTGRGDADRDAPTPIAGDVRFRLVSASGERNTCGLTRGNTLLCWGGSRFGSLSPLHAHGRCEHGSFPESCAQRPVPQGGGDQFVFLGRSLGNAMCALDVHGRPFCWGGSSTAVGNDYVCGESTPPALVGGGPFLADSKPARTN